MPKLNLTLKTFQERNYFEYQLMELGRIVCGLCFFPTRLFRTILVLYYENCMALCQAMDMIHRTISLKHLILMCKIAVCKKTEKQAPQESTAQQLSLGCSHFRITRTDSNVRTTLNSIINSATGENCSTCSCE